MHKVNEHKKITEEILYVKAMAQKKIISMVRIA